MKVAVVFENLGPYHLARLTAAHKVCEILGVEWHRRSRTYRWEPELEASSFERLTLLDDEMDHSSFQSAIRSLRRRIPPDSLKAIAVHGWGDLGAIPIITWASQSAIPLVIMSESQSIDFPRTFWREWVKQRVVALCSAALVGGRSHADYLAELGMERDRVFLGYDTVDNDYFARNAERSGKQKPALGKKYALPEKYFLASARFIEKKNLPRLLQAYGLYRQKAKSSKPDADTWDLVLLGDGPLRKALVSQLSTLNLHRHVHLPGFKQYPDLPAYYALASAFVHASTTEQWGLVVNEAMASGLPVLVSNRCGCAHDLVQEGGNGFTFDPLCIEQLAGLMLRLSTPNSQLSTMGAASQRIIDSWGPERFASGLKAAVDMAVKVGPKKANRLDRALLWALMRRGNA